MVGRKSLKNHIMEPHTVEGSKRTSTVLVLTQRTTHYILLLWGAGLWRRGINKLTNNETNDKRIPLAVVAHHTNTVNSYSLAVFVRYNGVY